MSRRSRFEIGGFKSVLSNQVPPNRCTELENGGQALQVDALKFINDPSAGSPTETLLRLLLPLNDQVRTTSRQLASLARYQ